MVEANDNHAETHTVAEFVEFCVNGRNDKSGEWTAQGKGEYLEGGKDAGGQLVDQRFCPRILEGELRYNCVVDALVGIIHKKHLRCWWHGLHLHLLRSRGGEVQELDDDFL
mmetsp:Transcript_101991/g.266196  ORF Transcript_101991/g.266196 Transcript_101991/m.266196 type:complete len:111 (-) Transcript_101991:99-431(-)